MSTFDLRSLSSEASSFVSSVSSPGGRIALIPRRALLVSSFFLRSASFSEVRTMTLLRHQVARARWPARLSFGSLRISVLNSCGIMSRNIPRVVLWAFSSSLPYKSKSSYHPSMWLATSASFLHWPYSRSTVVPAYSRISPSPTWSLWRRRHIVKPLPDSDFPPAS